jgi:hypothetical protein
LLGAQYVGGGNAFGGAVTFGRNCGHGPAPGQLVDCNVRATIDGSLDARAAVPAAWRLGYVESEE